VSINLKNSQIFYPIKSGNKGDANALKSPPSKLEWKNGKNEDTQHLSLKTSPFSKSGRGAGPRVGLLASRVIEAGDFPGETAA
jgi:hypothetical protein